MSILLLPFQVLGVPAKALLGLVGLFIAALANAVIFRWLLCIAAVQYQWIWVREIHLVVVMILSFVLTFVGSGKK